MSRVIAIAVVLSIGIILELEQWMRGRRQMHVRAVDGEWISVDVNEPSALERLREEAHASGVEWILEQRNSSSEESQFGKEDAIVA